MEEPPLPAWEALLPFPAGRPLPSGLRSLHLLGERCYLPIALQGLSKEACAHSACTNPLGEEAGCLPSINTWVSGTQVHLL